MVLVVQSLHISLISFKFSSGTNMVWFYESIRMPRHVAAVVGGTNFVCPISRLRFFNKSIKMYMLGQFLRAGLQI